MQLELSASGSQPPGLHTLQASIAHNSEAARTVLCCTVKFLLKLHKVRLLRTLVVGRKESVPIDLSSELAPVGAVAAALHNAGDVSTHNLKHRCATSYSSSLRCRNV